MIPDDFEIRYEVEIKRKSKKHFLSKREEKLLSLLKSVVDVPKICKEVSCTLTELNALINEINSDDKLVLLDGGSLKLTKLGKGYLEYFERLSEAVEFYSAHPYVRPAVTVDGLIFYGERIVIIKRKNFPFKGEYALPGGYVNYGETVENAVVREMVEEIGQPPEDLKLVSVVSDPSRDPRGHTISVVFTGRISDPPVAGDDASSVLLVYPKEIIKKKMAFDHQDIIRTFIQ